MTKAEGLNTQMFALCPDFANWDEAEWSLWVSDDGTSNVLTVFSHYISDKLKAEKPVDIDAVFRFIESNLGDDEEIDNATTTCCLENIMNCVSESIDPATFVGALGPKLREFCKAWDEWCGLKTVGL